MSESGRAIASHFSVLVFNVLGTGGLPQATPLLQRRRTLIVRNLRDTLEGINTLPQDGSADVSRLQEAWNDALKFKDDALAAFRLGYLSLTDRSRAEQLTWSCARSLVERLPRTTISPTNSRNYRPSWPYLLRQSLDFQVSPRHLGHPTTVSVDAAPHSARNPQNSATSLTSPAIPMVASTVLLPMASANRYWNFIPCNPMSPI